MSPTTNSIQRCLSEFVVDLLRPRFGRLHLDPPSQWIVSLEGVFLRSASGIALERAVSLTPSTVNSPKSFGKYNTRRLYLRPRFVDGGTYCGSPSFATRRWRKTFSSKRSSSACGSSSYWHLCVSSGALVSGFGCQSSRREGPGYLIVLYHGFVLVISWGVVITAEL